jgi:hypothetical protein
MLTARDGRRWLACGVCVGCGGGSPIGGATGSMGSGVGLGFGIVSGSPGSGGGERALGGEAWERRRIPACRLSSFSRSIECSKAYAELKARAKTSGRFGEVRFGARSAAGRMTPLSLAHAGARTQILRSHYHLQATVPT